MDYYSFPFLKLCRIFQDDGRCEDFGVSKEDWESIKEQFNEANPSPGTDILMEQWKDAIRASIDLNRNIALITYIMQYDADWEVLFELAGIRYTGDREKDAEYLSLQLKKLETKVQVYTARLKKLQDDISESKKDGAAEPFSIKKAYKALAALEKQGATIPDYEKFTCGQYDAFCEIIKEENGKRNDNGR